MRSFVLFSGCWNIAAALSICVMWAVVTDSLFVGGEQLHVRLQPRGLFWTLMLAGILLFTGLMLVLASRNLRARGTLVTTRDWPGLLRLLFC